MAWKTCCLGLITISLVVHSGDAVAQTEQPVKEADTSAEAKRVERRLQVFELKHCQPSDFAQLLAIRRQRELRIVESPGGALTEVREIAMLPENLNVAFEDRKRLLFVRGTAKGIQAIEKLVKTLDAPPDKLGKQTWEEVHLFPVRHAEAGSIQAVLSQLGFTTHAASLGKASLIVVLQAEDEDLEQIQEVIAKLDQAEAATTTVETTTATEQTR
jgi:type II secretory pathway component GspD/PulD (secretin)